MYVASLSRAGVVSFLSRMECSMELRLREPLRNEENGQIDTAVLTHTDLQCCPSWAGLGDHDNPGLLLATRDSLMAEVIRYCNVHPAVCRNVDCNDSLKWLLFKDTAFERYCFKMDLITEPRKMCPEGWG